jgi:hypothetical protein
MGLLPFFFVAASLCIAQKGSAKKASSWKFYYLLTNSAKNSKLAALKQLKFLRLLIVVGPSLKFH